MYFLEQVQSVREYASEFENLVQKTNQSVITLDNIFYQNLKDNINSEHSMLEEWLPLAQKSCPGGGWEINILLVQKVKLYL